MSLVACCGASSDDDLARKLALAGSDGRLCTAVLVCTEAAVRGRMPALVAAGFLEGCRRRALATRASPGRGSSRSTRSARRSGSAMIHMYCRTFSMVTSM